VVCDDARTAVSYFDLLKRLIKGKLTLTVVPKPHCRASAKEVVEVAKKKLNSLQQARSHDEEADRNSVWALIDLEDTSASQEAARNAKKAGEKLGIQVALSNPCYEVWTLLHLVDTGKTFANCNAVRKSIEHEWLKCFGQEFGKKAQADYFKIIEDRTKAAARAKKHREAYDGEGDPSWTEVYLLSNEIDRLCDSESA